MPRSACWQGSTACGGAVKEVSTSAKHFACCCGHTEAARWPRAHDAVVDQASGRVWQQVFKCGTGTGRAWLHVVAPVLAHKGSQGIHVLGLPAQRSGASRARNQQRKGAWALSSSTQLGEMRCQLLTTSTAALVYAVFVASERRIWAERSLMILACAGAPAVLHPHHSEGTAGARLSLVLQIHALLRIHRRQYACEAPRTPQYIVLVSGTLTRARCKRFSAPLARLQPSPC